MVVYDARMLRVYIYPVEVMKLTERYSLLEVMDMCNVAAYLGKLSYKIIELKDIADVAKYNPTFTIYEDKVKLNENNC